MRKRSMEDEKSPMVRDEKTMGDIEQKMPKSYSPMRNRLFLSCYSAMVIFGWLVPNDLLIHSPGLGAFTDFMASIVPQIDRVTELGGATAGNANRVVYSVLWVAGIVLGIANAIVVIKQRSRRRTEVCGRLESIWQQILYSALAFYLVVVEGLYMYSLRPELRLVRFSLVNRFGAGVFAPLLTVGIAVLTIGCVGVCVLFAINLVKKSQGDSNE